MGKKKKTGIGSTWWPNDAAPNLEAPGMVQELPNPPPCPPQKAPTHLEDARSVGRPPGVEQVVLPRAHEPFPCGRSRRRQQGPSCPPRHQSLADTPLPAPTGHARERVWEKLEKGEFLDAHPSTATACARTQPARGSPSPRCGGSEPQPGGAAGLFHGKNPHQHPPQDKSCPQPPCSALPAPKPRAQPQRSPGHPGVRSARRPHSPQ